MLRIARNSLFRSKIHRTLRPTSPNPPTHLAKCTDPSPPTSHTHPIHQYPTTHLAKRTPGGLRQFSDNSSEVDEINLRFAEAREDIEAAMESKETIYFDEEAEVARESVKRVLERYERLLQRASEEEKGALVRSMGLKMQQLRAEVEQLDD